MCSNTASCATAVEEDKEVEERKVNHSVKAGESGSAEQTSFPTSVTKCLYSSIYITQIILSHLLVLHFLCELWRHGRKKH